MIRQGIKLFAVLALLLVLVSASACVLQSAQSPSLASRRVPSRGISSRSAEVTASAPVIALARRNGLTVVGPGSSVEETLATYADRANHSPAGTVDRSGLMDEAFLMSAAVGLDLRSHLGQDVVVSDFPLRQLDQNRYPKRLWVVLQNDRIIGAWVTVDGLLGGFRQLKHGR